MDNVNDDDIESLEIDSNDELDAELIDTDSNIISVNGHYGVIDSFGFHPSPSPSFEEEIRRNPDAAMKNRLIRAKVIKRQGHKELANQLLLEAEQISRMISQNQAPKNPLPKSKLRFSH